MRCDDPLLRAFKAYGYNVVRLPSASFTPLLLLESDGRRTTRRIGPVALELPGLSPEALPRLHEDDPAPDLAVQTTRQFSGRLVADFLGPILALMGADLGVSGALGDARGLSIVLRDVRRDWVDVGELARYLESGVGAGSRHVMEAANQGHLYVVNAILKSASFATGVDREVARQVQARASIAGPLEVAVQHSGERGDSTVVSFTGRTPLTFAFQAVRLVYEDGVYTDFATAKGLSGYAMPGAELPVEGMLVLDDDLVEVPEGIPGVAG